MKWFRTFAQLCAVNALFLPRSTLLRGSFPHDLSMMSTLQSTPQCIKETAAFKEASEMSQVFKSSTLVPLEVAIIGGGLAGLSCAKYLSDAGHKPTIYEGRDILGGKVAAWQDDDGDWIETGLHVFFGAYPNMMNLFLELGIEDRLQWKSHQMYFALPGKFDDAGNQRFASFEFPDLPAPINAAARKIRFGIGLIPVYLFGQSYIDAQDELSVSEWMARQNVPERVKDEVFVAMAKALNFIDPEELSMTVILTALNRFLREKGGSRVAFLDGPPTTRLCIPLAERIVSNGGQVLTNKRLQKIRVSDTNGAVEALELGGGETVKADAYVSALPVDILKTKLPEEWTHAHSYFSDMQQLEGVPVINVHLWFDRKLCNIDNLLFSRSKLLSVYADMSTCCRAYENNERSMLELVFAPAGSFIGKPDVEIVAATMGELEKLFPNELGSENGAQLVKAHVVQTARSVYTAVKGTGALRPTQVSPIRNFFLAGCFTRQKYLASMEGAVLSGKLAAQAVLESQEERKGLGYSR